MNRFQQMPAVNSHPRRHFFARVWESVCDALHAWVSQDPPASLHMGRKAPAVVICYECRRRVSAEEIAAGLHDHAKAAAAAADSQANEQ